MPWATASLLMGLLTLMFAIMFEDVPSKTVSLDMIKAVFGAGLILFLIAVVVLYTATIHRSTRKNLGATTNPK